VHTRRLIQVSFQTGYVDGIKMSPLEFWVHDIQHAKRNWDEDRKTLISTSPSVDQQLGAYNHRTELRRRVTVHSLRKRAPKKERCCTHTRLFALFLALEHGLQILEGEKLTSKFRPFRTRRCRG